jgi:carboxypeptidase C (cathepsin A)
VFVICGYYDMATMVGGIEFSMRHLAYEKQITDRVSFGYYQGGHMMYIRPSAHAALKKDLAALQPDLERSKGGQVAFRPGLS